MKALYVDAFSGISGNMFVGGLFGLGLPEEYLREKLALLDIGEYRLVIETTMKCGISATYFNVALGGEQEEQDGCCGQHRHDHHGHGKHEHCCSHGHGQREHHHGHHGHHAHSGHGQHEHRTYKDIMAILTNSKLEEKIKKTAVSVFQKLAAAEGKIHNKPLEEVNFHEVGAVDTIIDVVGTVIGLDYLGIEKVFVSKVRTGFGFVNCAHGRMPVPAPATAELLAGIPSYAGDIEKELATPTGAAILAALADVTADTPAGFAVEKIAYGAGSYDLPIPNTLRLFLGKMAEQEHGLCILETNVDDMNPQLYGHVMNKMFSVGATDVWITPIIMKKGRPACKLSVLLPESLAADAAKEIFLETSSLGIRYHPVKREIADRRTLKVALPYGEVHVKLGEIDGKLVNIAPEFEDCSRLAAMNQIPLKRIWQEAMQKAMEEVKF